MNPAEQSPAGAAIREALLDVGRQIEAILATAEQAAADIRARAEEDAERYLEERRQTANQVVAAQIERLERFSHELVTEASRALSPIPGTVGSGGNGAPPRATPPPPETPPPPATPRGPAISREEALLQATQMAIAKKGRTEIEAALRNELGAEESRQITEEVLGRPMPEGF